MLWTFLGGLRQVKIYDHSLSVGPRSLNMCACNRRSLYLYRLFDQLVIINKVAVWFHQVVYVFLCSQMCVGVVLELVPPLLLQRCVVLLSTRVLCCCYVQFVCYLLLEKHKDILKTLEVFQNHARPE